MNNELFWAAFEDEISKIAGKAPSYFKGHGSPVTVQSLRAEDAAKAKPPTPSYAKGTTGPITVQSLREGDKKRADLKAAINNPNLPRAHVRYLKTKLSNM